MLKQVEAALMGAMSSQEREVIDSAVDTASSLLNADPGESHVIYCLDKARKSYTVERKKHYCKRAISLIRGRDSLPYSDIIPSRWMNYPDVKTESIWIMKSRKRDEFHDASYWGNFVPQIPEQLITRFSKAGEVILDPFMGMGTTIAEARRLGRSVIGVELSGEIIGKATEKLAKAGLLDGHVRVVEGDASKVTEKALFGEWKRSVDLIIMHPPYHDIIRFSDSPDDLSNSKSVDHFLQRLKEVLENLNRYLPAGRFLVLVIGDKYSGGEWIPLGFLSMRIFQENGYLLKSIVVKNFEGTRGKRLQENLWRFRALKGGYYTFRHEYIFVFRKR
jgi:SAM-dependent methyltransferase